MLGGVAAVSFALTGCAGTYDLVTSQRFEERPFHTLFTREHPIDVLEHVQEGDDRASDACSGRASGERWIAPLIRTG